MKAKARPKKLTSKEPFKPEVNPWLSLAQAIVYQAILDWWALDEGRAPSQTNYNVLRNFFMSPWCDTLLLFTSIEPRHIVERLEKHSREATV